MKSLDNLLEGLNPPQREAVRQTEGPVLILAGAGSGKTRVITARIAYIIGTRKATPSQILAVTFTNKAAGEMRDRVAGLIGKKAAGEIVLSTFHSFCLRVLRREIERLGYRKDFTIASESETRSRVRRILTDVDGLRESFSPEAFIERIGMIKNRDGDENHQSLEPNAADDEKYKTWLPEVYERYQSSLRAANTVDFDDLLLLTLQLWREHPDVLRRHQTAFRYLMVDEFQDTNGVQCKLLHALAEGHRNLCVVGDDDQSIYGWRGADIRNILEYERIYPDAKVIKLEQNYRSTETILEAANRVIAHNANRRDKKLWSTLGKGREIDRIVTGDDDHEAKSMVTWLKTIQSKTDAKYSDFAILYRSNTQSRPIEIAFRQEGIPYTVYGGQDFFERAEVRDVLAYLKAIQNPRDEISCLRIINVPRRGIGDVTLHRIHELCRIEKLSFHQGLFESLRHEWLTAEARKGIQDYLSLTQDFRRALHTPGRSIKAVVRDLVERVDYKGEIGRTSKTTEQMMARWANVEAVIDAIGAYEADHPGATLSAFLDDTSLDGGDDRKARSQRRQEGVSLMTIHSAKGLEFPFVFIAGLEEGSLPHERSVREGTLEEERRLFYVALTRGKRHVTLFEALSRNRHGKERMTKTSRFVAEIPEPLVKTRILAAREMVEAKVAPPRPRPRPRRKPIRR